MVDYLPSYIIDGLRTAINTIRINANYLRTQPGGSGGRYWATYAARCTYEIRWIVTNITGVDWFPMSANELYNSWHDELVDRW